MDNAITSIMETTMAKMREMVDVDTIVGSPITTPDGITIIPISKVSFGFGSGGMAGANQNGGINGGAGGGVKIDPIGFLIVKDGNIRMINITEPASGAIERAIEKAPEMIDKIDEFITKHKKGSQE
ncbi:MAG: sporulation protein YtfJ [Oscillospiraceae bacterium]|nr:sporulation protein YtfJ [Oscillospiraceae bacterium]MBR5261618.1 sporulation protein YtfJ [Oscillospiraceae bacterium]